MSAVMEPSRNTSYTTVRPDVFAMVPATAKTILDVGCSNGALGASLRHAVAGRRVVGIEDDGQSARDAASRLDEVTVVDLNKFEWGSWQGRYEFDCIIFADVLEHLVDPPRQLREAQRVLARNGAIVISLPNVRHISAFWSIFVGGTFPRRDRGIFDKDHLRWFTISDARSLVADAGLSIEAMSYSLRLRDAGGGFVNKIVNRALDPVQDMFPVREFLAYQFCLRAVMA